MVKQSRKQSRRSRKQQSRRNHRRNQRGGAASFNAPYEALTGPARDAAQVGPLDRSIAALPGLIPRQGGGQRGGDPDASGNNAMGNNAMGMNINSPDPVWAAPASVQVGGSAPFGDPYTYKLNGGRRYRRKNKKSRRNSRSRQRNQRGGNAPFNASYSFGYKLPGVNEQFANEGSVNSLYSQNRGAQGY